jgi:hypothetical protein
MWFRLLVIVGVVLGLAACKERKNKPNDGLIFEVPAALRESKEATDKRLEQEGLKYTPGYKAYSGGKALLDPCLSSRIETLKNAESELRGIYISLDSKNMDYRDGALRFYREAQDSYRSIQRINELLFPYCEENAKLARCTGGGNSIKASINIHIAGHLIVHPYALATPGAKLLLYTFETNTAETDIRVKEIESGEDGRRNPLSMLREITDVRGLTDIKDCLTSKKPGSTVGKFLVKTFTDAVTESKAYCLKNKKYLEDEGYRRGNSSLFRFCLGNSDL